MYLIEEVQRKDNTELVIFSRDIRRKKQTEIIKNFKPYFYVPYTENIPSDYRITSIESGYKSIDKIPLKKIFVKKSSDIPAIRKIFSKCYESDINIKHRYIIDKLGEIQPYELNTLYLDIELETEHIFPNMKDPDQAITCITCVDSFTDKTITFLYKHKDSSETIIESPYVKVYDSEENMLNGFLYWISNNDHDIITGWNVINFDLLYLIKRLQKLELDYTLMSPMRNVYITETEWLGIDKVNITIKGIILLDMMELYKYYRRITNQGKAEAYSLDFTARSLLKKGKIKFDSTFKDLWINHPNKLIEYNEVDTRLVKEIDDKLKIIEFFNNIRCKACSQLSDVYYTSTLVDGLILSKTLGNPVLPDKNYNSDEEKYTGAHVISPNPGLYNNILALDISGMYPNIIKTFNIGYETFNPNGEIKISEGISFDKGTSLITNIINQLGSERKRNKKLRDESTNENDWKRYDYQQYAVKVITNSIYGYLGFPKSRLYKKEIANAITTMGRNILEESKLMLETILDYNVIYGDTDSLYVQGKSTDLFSLIMEGNKLATELNNFYIKLVNKYGADDCTLQMEFEKIFKKILFVGKRGETEGAKKRYAYIALWKNNKNTDDNKIEYTGFDSVRSDSCRIARDIQEQVIKMVLLEYSKSDVIKYIKGIEKQIRNKELSDQIIGFPKGISKELCEYTSTMPPHIAGSVYSNKYLGTRFSKGSKPKWIYVKHVPKGYPNTHVIAYEECIPEGFVIDYDKLNERIFKMKLDSIFKSRGWGEFPSINSTITTI